MKYLLAIVVIVQVAVAGIAMAVESDTNCPSGVQANREANGSGTVSNPSAPSAPDSTQK